jgi:hypothetical protein
VSPDLAEHSGGPATDSHRLPFSPACRPTTTGQQAGTRFGNRLSTKLSHYSHPPSLGQESGRLTYSHFFTHPLRSRRRERQLVAPAPVRAAVASFGRCRTHRRLLPSSRSTTFRPFKGRGALIRYTRASYPASHPDRLAGPFARRSTPIAAPGWRLGERHLPRGFPCTPDSNSQRVFLRARRPRS